MNFVFFADLGAAFLGLFLKAMLEEASGPKLGPDMLVKVAAEGNLSAVQSIIKNHPSQVTIAVKSYR